MNPAARDAAALIRAAANHASDPDLVVRADARTSLYDARAALWLAKGVALEDIDPATGTNWSAAAYEEARRSWRAHVAHTEPLTEFTRPWFEKAYVNWLKRRPDLAAGDDWLAGIKLECGDCGALVPAIDAAKACRYDQTERPPRLIEQYAICPACAGIDKNGA